MYIILTVRAENNGIQSIFVHRGYKFFKFSTELFYGENETLTSIQVVSTCIVLKAFPAL